MSLLNAINYIPTTQKGNSVQTYQGATDVVNAAQMALLKAGLAGTDGALLGVTARMADYGVVVKIDTGGNAILRRTPGSPYNIDAVTGLIDHFGSLGGFKNKLETVNLGAAALGTNTAITAAITLPTADSTTGIHAAITQTTASQTITAGITNPAGRLPTITGGFAGQVGPVVISGLDLNGAQVSCTLMLSGTSTVKATLLQLPTGLNTVTSIVVPPYTNNGSDTVAIGFSNLVQITGITNPDVQRVLLAKGSTAGIAGTVNILGYDDGGTLVLESIASSGASAVNGTLALQKVIAVSVPQQNAGGNTISIGTTGILGLPYRMDHNAVYKTIFGTTPEATAPTVTFDATNLAGNTVLLSSALDGSHQVIVDFLRCDAPVEWDRK